MIRPADDEKIAVVLVPFPDKGGPLTLVSEALAAALGSTTRDVAAQVREHALRFGASYSRARPGAHVFTLSFDTVELVLMIVPITISGRDPVIAICATLPHEQLAGERAVNRLRHRLRIRHAAGKARLH